MRAFCGSVPPICLVTLTLLVLLGLLSRHTSTLLPPVIVGVALTQNLSSNAFFIPYSVALVSLVVVGIMQDSVDKSVKPQATPVVLVVVVVEGVNNST